MSVANRRGASPSARPSRMGPSRMPPETRGGQRMERQGTRLDRRARRTRTLLQHAFLEVLQQKRFDSITIQDITEQADVSRTTFYAYFPDKYALLEATLRAPFQ